MQYKQKMVRKILVLQQDEFADTQVGVGRMPADNILLGRSLREEQNRIAYEKPSLIVVDLHSMDMLSWHIARQIKAENPHTKFLFTTHHTAPQLEQKATNWLSATIVPHPLTPEKINYAYNINSNKADEPNSSAAPLKVKVPLRTKIAIPYIILALILVLGAFYLAIQFVTINVQDRFASHLVETAQLTADWMTREEQSRLETMRLIVNTDGVQESLLANDPQTLRKLIVPLAVNSQEDAVEILDVNGEAVLSLHHQVGGNIEDYVASSGERVFAEWGFVQQVLRGESDNTGDKYAGISQAEWGDFLYIAGPIKNADGDLIGVILVGRLLPELARQLRQETFGQISIYDLAGNLLTTTLPQNPENLAEQSSAILSEQDDHSHLRVFGIGSIDYSELLAPFEARNGEDLGVIGSALSQTFLVQATDELQGKVFFFVLLSFLAILLTGIILAKWITDPIRKIMWAFARVSQGDLTVQVEPTGNDEVAVLGEAFNHMVADLREGDIYRDLLGRAVTPEVRELLRQQLQSGDLRLEGQTVTATILYSDIRGFTTISEETGPVKMFAYLNQYLEKVIPAITAEGGVVNEFAGDALVAVFGILPKSLPASDSAHHACKAALAIEKAIIQLNQQREVAGQPMFVTGIGVTTGNVVIGAVGSADRLHFSVVGDPVNTAHRLQEMNKAIGETSVIISEFTTRALGSRSKQFHYDTLGNLQLRGKEKSIDVYRLYHRPN